MYHLLSRTLLGLDKVCQPLLVHDLIFDQAGGLFALIHQLWNTISEVDGLLRSAR
jgi:hypothetical protein